jgi:hypothetical protein
MYTTPPRNIIRENNMAKKKLVYQTVNIQDILNRLLRECENGDLMTAAGRTFANVESGNSRIYSFSIIVTCDDDDIAFNYDIPFVDAELLQQGQGVIRAPEGHLASSRTVAKKTLEFPERW